MNRSGPVNHNKYEGTFYFDPADKIYEDHFPGNPVVPGSLIVHAFSEAGKKTGFVADCLTIENFRFREFVTPGEYSYTLEVLSDRLKCRLYRSGETLVTGIFKK